MAVVVRIVPTQTVTRSDPPFETHEHYGVGETLERHGIPWKAVEGRSMVGGDPNRSEIVFVPEDDADNG